MGPVAQPQLATWKIYGGWEVARSNPIMIPHVQTRRVMNCSAEHSRIVLIGQFEI
jgi:hypothetical protein